MLKQRLYAMLFKESLFPLLDLCGPPCESRGALQLPLADLLDVDLEGRKSFTRVESGDMSTYGIGSLHRQVCE